MASSTRASANTSMALREDEEAAEASGVPTFRCKIVIIAISAAATALAGTFYAQFLLFIVPETLFSFDHILNMMLGTIVGGSGTSSDRLSARCYSAFLATCCAPCLSSIRARRQAWCGSAMGWF